MGSSRPRTRTPQELGDPKALVRAGWNRLSSTYRPPRSSADCFAHPERDYVRWLRPVLDTVPPRGSVLDLGCGNGIPAARLLAPRFRVTGVDLSEVMIRRARRAVPAARFHRADMATIDFAARSFDAVVSFYAIIHLPLPEQRPLFRRIHAWLKPGGVFVAMLGHAAVEEVDSNWLNSGVPMYWSHADARTYARWLEAAGLEVRHQEFVPEGTGGHELFWTTWREVRSRAGTAGGPQDRPPRERRALPNRRPGAAAASVRRATSC